MAKLIQAGDIDSVASGYLVSNCVRGNCRALQSILNASTVTKEVTEILTPLEKSNGKRFVLIEGAPGIGKSFLMKYIACQWGQKLMLENFKIMLLVCLRDPKIWQITSICDLLKIYCKGYTEKRANKFATICADYLLINDRRDIAFLLDGYDELPDTIKKSGLINGILNRTTLPLCGLVVSSRPHKENPHQIKELTHYLHCHPTINSICFAPLNMTILLFLYRLGIPLPSFTELHHHFICQTICQHLAKSGVLLNNTIVNLTTLPEPYKVIVQQLGKLSLEALNKNRLIFSTEQIQEACPDILTAPGGINGFGLLQAVKHIGLTGKTMTFNFLHLTIQEYLAAYYIITNLQQNEEFDLLYRQFWNNLYANVFAIYVKLTKGQRPAFKKFLSGGDNKTAISSQFLNNRIKSIRLYRYFKDAGDDRMCKSIEAAKTFDVKEINLTKTSLSINDLECASLFLTASSHKHWVWLSLFCCHIQDHNHIIHKYPNQSNITITKLWLGDNNLTKASSTFISDIVLSCNVEVLWINSNHTPGRAKSCTPC